MLLDYIKSIYIRNAIRIVMICFYNICNAVLYSVSFKVNKCNGRLKNNCLPLFSVVVYIKCMIKHRTKQWDFKRIQIQSRLATGNEKEKEKKEYTLYRNPFESREIFEGKPPLY